LPRLQRRLRLNQPKLHRSPLKDSKTEARFLYRNRASAFYVSIYSIVCYLVNQLRYSEPMKIARALNKAEANRLQSLILFGSASTTLAMWTQLEDPINLPKMFVLVLSGAAVMGLALPTLFGAKNLPLKNQKIALILLALFFAGLFVSTAATDVKYTAIFGEYHRNNGALSYFAMLIIMLGSVIAFDLKSVGKFLHIFSATGIVLACYGILQGIGQDPVDWVIQYNPFVSTLGNPNFTSAFLGLSGVATLLVIFTSKNKNLKAVFLAGLLVNIFILFKTGSIQGVFGFAIGATVIILTKLWITNKRYGQIGILTAIFVSLPVVLALINLGPLASRVYQGTLKNRFDYWNAALAMFKDHPLFGVGTDRFGEYYREYAVQNQVVQGQITDNAHSIYMQLLATGGLFTFIPYALLVIFITYIGMSALVKASSSEKLLISGVLAIWLATITVNLVTVDSLGVGIWFWVTGGVLVAISGVSRDKESDVKTKSNQKYKSDNDAFPLGYFMAAMLLIFSLILMVPQISNSSSLLTLKKTLPGLSSQDYISRVLKASEQAENNPQLLIQLADLSFRQGAIVDGLRMLDRVNEIDDRSYYGNYFAAVVNETTGKKSEAIKYRERLKDLDPWNNTSLIELIKDYIAAGKRDSAVAIAALIKKNYPGSQADIDASALLVG
jgi:O-antigen ligase